MTDKPLFILRSQNPGEATISLKKKKGKTKQKTIDMWCEFIVTSDDDSNLLPIGITLWNSQSEDLEYISIAGPLNQPQRLKDGREGLTDLELSLYYRALRSYEPPKGQRKTRNNSGLEYMTGDIWQQKHHGLRFILDLDLVLRHKLLGHVRKLEFVSPLFQSDSHLKRSRRPDISEMCKLHVQGQKTLKMRFIVVDANKAKLPDDLAPWIDCCWLLGVKDMWAKKANICLDIKRINPVDVGDFDTEKDEAEIRTAVNKILSPAEQEDRLAVYLVRNLRKSHGGGTKYPPRLITSDAYIILQVTNETCQSGYQNLLAHELCHVFGTLHPEDLPRIITVSDEGRITDLRLLPGGIDTLAEPGQEISTLPGNYVPSPSINPRSNFPVLTKLDKIDELAHILERKPTIAADCQDAVWNPDPEPWYIWVTDQPLHPNYNDSYSKERCYENGMPVRPVKDQLKSQLNRDKVHLCVRLNDLQLQHYPVTVQLYLVNAKLIQPLDIDPCKYFFTFYKAIPEVLDDDWINLKRSEFIVKLGGEAAYMTPDELKKAIDQEIRMELSRRTKTRCVKWNIGSNLKGEYTLYAVLKYGQPYPTQRTQLEQELIKSLETGEINDTSKWFIRQQSPQCYGDHVQSVPISFGAFQTQGTQPGLIHPEEDL